MAAKKAIASKAGQTARIDLPAKKASADTGTLTISGVPAEVYRSEEKVRALMDALGLPKGTSVRITVEAGSVIVR
ncbi:MAG TPA: hypothetical protein VM733_05025 [Thermoanaerobaculia bacterium]|nr:hypothetical protein [Thermoanaerobaculia bacterium]